MFELGGRVWGGGAWPVLAGLWHSERGSDSVVGVGDFFGPGPGAVEVEVEVSLTGGVFGVRQDFGGRVVLS